VLRSLSIPVLAVLLAVSLLSGQCFACFAPVKAEAPPAHGCCKPLEEKKSHCGDATEEKPASQECAEGRQIVPDTVKPDSSPTQLFGAALPVSDGQPEPLPTPARRSVVKTSSAPDTRPELFVLYSTFLI
jgi:hypothetical protein